MFVELGVGNLQVLISLGVGSLAGCPRSQWSRHGYALRTVGRSANDMKFFLCRHMLISSNVVYTIDLVI